MFLRNEKINNCTHMNRHTLSVGDNCKQTKQKKREENDIRICFIFPNEIHVISDESSIWMFSFLFCLRPQIFLFASFFLHLSLSVTEMGLSILNENHSRVFSSLLFGVNSKVREMSDYEYRKLFHFSFRNCHKTPNSVTD